MARRPSAAFGLSVMADGVKPARALALMYGGEADRRARLMAATVRLIRI